MSLQGFIQIIKFIMITFLKRVIYANNQQVNFMYQTLVTIVESVLDLQSVIYIGLLLFWAHGKVNIKWRRFKYWEIWGILRGKSNYAIRKSVVDNVGVPPRSPHIPVFIFVYTPIPTQFCCTSKGQHQGTFRRSTLSYLGQNNLNTFVYNWLER